MGLFMIVPYFVPTVFPIYKMQSIFRLTIRNVGERVQYPI